MKHYRKTVFNHHTEHTEMQRLCLNIHFLVGQAETCLHSVQSYSFCLTSNNEVGHAVRTSYFMFIPGLQGKTYKIQQKMNSDLHVT